MPKRTGIWKCVNKDCNFRCMNSSKARKHEQYRDEGDDHSCFHYLFEEEGHITRELMGWEPNRNGTMSPIYSYGERAKI